MTTTQPAPIDYSKGPAWIKPSEHGMAQFPPASQLPKAAAAAVEPLLALRRRKADAERAQREANGALRAAKLADATALLEHVRAGGRAAEFQGTTEEAAKKAQYAQADLSALDKLLGEQYETTGRALQRMADEGAQLAAVNAEKAAAAFSAAITELEQARQEYLAACGVVLFWRYLIDKGRCVVAGGDQIHLSRGPVTKVDSTTVVLLRADAQTHVRVAEADL